jgi:acyl-CoA thioester hydrolase
MTAFLSYRGTVYAWHCDHVGHMNVMWYAAKFDEASWSFLTQIGITPSYLRKTERGMAAVQQNINYKRELLSGDIVEVHSRLLQIGDKSIRFVHEMRNGETGDVAAISELTAVHLDRRLRKSCPFTPEIRSAGENLLSLQAA